MPLDDADKKFILEAIKTAGEAQSAETVKLVDGKLKPFGERLDAAEKTAKEKPEPKKDKPEPEKDKDDPTARELAALRKKLEDSETEKKAEKEARARDQLRAAARDALIEAGVPAERAKLALAYLESEKLIASDEKTGTNGFRVKDKYDVESIVAGKKGAEAWLATDEGKAFLPPRQVAGTGDGAGGPQSGQGKAPRTEKGGLDWGALASKISTNKLALAE